MKTPAATWNPERDLWETDTMDLFSGLSDVFSETLPISGMTRSGRLFLRPQSEPPMVGSESSSSLGRVFDTPDTMPDAPNSGSNRKSQPAGLGNQVKALLRTPCAAEAEGGMLHPDKAEREGQTLRLSSQIVHMVAPDQLKDDLLPTPRASDPATTSSHASPGFTKPLGQVARESCADTFGPYADAIARWESVMGREAPAPTELTLKGKHRLSAKFVEFMMGQSDGWVTDEELGLSRVQQLRALGNGVVTQQAVFAIEWLLERAQDQTRKAA